jgi:quercetin dioxygenase-like cupin family protein
MVAQPRPLPHRMTAGIVRFAPGSRTAWHVHVLGQTLRVAEGIALVQARGGRAVAVHPGETVNTPPGEWHWHGATEESFMTHLALSVTPPEGKDRRSPGATTSRTRSTRPPTKDSVTSD